jgi:thiamine biosynthesis protein ThiS
MVNHTTETVEIRVNAQTAHVPAGLNILTLLRHLNVAPDRVAVELNREIVRQPEWDMAEVRAGAEIEIVQFVGGG